MGIWAPKGGGMTCLTCKSLDLLNREMAKVGYGHCAYSLEGSFNSVTHSRCEKFTSAPADVGAQRIEWINKSRSVK